MGVWIVGCMYLLWKWIKLCFWIAVGAVMICGGIVGTATALAVYSLFNYHIQESWPIIFLFLGIGGLAWSVKFILLKHFAYSGRVLWFV